MAYNLNAKGNRGNTAGPVRTPAPDVISTVRAPGVAGFGQNGGINNPSSVPAGKTVRSQLAQNLLDSVDDGGALDRVIAQGTARQDDAITGQLRTLADGNVPIHSAMSSAPRAAFPGGNSSAAAPKENTPKPSAANAKYNDAMRRSTKPGAKASPGQLAASTKLS